MTSTAVNGNGANVLRSVGHLAVARRWSSNDTKPETSPSSSAEEASTEATPEASAVNNEKFSQLEKEIKDLKDRVMRSMAEEENVRRIAKRDVDNARAYAVTGFAKSLLDVADDFERALAAAPKAGAEGTADAAASLKTLVTGIAMTEKTLQKAFAQHGVVKYGAIGDTFDPALHDALYAIPAEGDKKSGTIGQVLKSGYKLKDRVLRPAEVGSVA